MRLFRRSLDPAQASPRLATPVDLTAISRLFRNNAHRYLGFPSGDLPALLNSAPAQLLVAGDEVWGAAICGWRAGGTTWLRGVALIDGLPVEGGLLALLTPFHALVRGLGVEQLFYAGTEAADIWLQPALQTCGYTHDTDVIVYEKRNLGVPSNGNQVVRVRRVEVADLAAVLAVDQRCFHPQWFKDEGVIGPAIFESPYFIVAELHDEIAGYAFVTAHYGGRLVHLVRIAVLPEYRGQAVGVRLLAEVVNYAKANGAETLTLNTQANNLGARRLYEWFGFRRTGEQQTVLRFDLTETGQR